MITFSQGGAAKVKSEKFSGFGLRTTMVIISLKCEYPLNFLLKSAYMFEDNRLN